MSLFDFKWWHRPDAEREKREIPLFPLSAVLFPGGRLGLKVFEQRYLDMTAACMKAQTPFGICLIAEGQEVGATAEPHSIGTLAEIVSWDMEQLGILMLSVRGGARFRILERHSEASGLLRARVELLPTAPPQPVPDALQPLLPLLQRIVADLGPEKVPEPHAFDDMGWVGYRLSEVMPVQNLAKQKLLELDDDLSRLEILDRFLRQRGVLK
ncbi:MAG: hypothetical protein RIR00_1429 [Pseudomonadota bacterium]